MLFRSLLPVLDVAQLKEMQQKKPGLPTSELLQAATLIRFTQINANSFDIWVRITNAARTTLPVLIPYARLS